MLRFSDRDFNAEAIPQQELVSLKNTGVSAHAVDIDYSGNEYSAVGAFYNQNSKLQEIGTRYANSAVANTQRPIASIAKIITALVVVDHLKISSSNPGETMTITGADENDWKQAVAQNETNLPVYARASFTYAQLVHGMLVVSANNIANLLAAHAFGAFTNYKHAAAEYLKRHNLNSTTIGSDASGFDSSTTSSLQNLVELGKLTLENDFLKDAVAQNSVQWCAGSGQTNVWHTNSTDALLGSDGFVGIKTGFTDDAGGCFLFAAKRQLANTDVYLIGVVLGSPSVSARFSIAKNIVDSVDLQNSGENTGFSNFATSSWELGKVELLSNMSVVAKYNTIATVKSMRFLKNLRISAVLSGVMRSKLVLLIILTH
ncbi:MAG: hypothetical protein LBP35_00815 [Candidatus Ancillula trichonymphae]|jgi:D-alanyl-D-alanine carboxypeptidase (penicillin-binding protein 5/6)|nr:hypothetical protein [Candidatus Ancillula trichonymphae]